MAGSEQLRQTVQDHLMEYIQLASIDVAVSDPVGCADSDAVAVSSLPKVMIETPSTIQRVPLSGVSR